MQKTQEQTSSRSAEKLYKFFIYLVLVLLAVTIIVPVAWVFMASVKQNSEFYGNPWALPAGFYWQNFVDAWNGAKMGQYMLNSVAVTALALALLLVILFSVNLGWLPAMGIGGIEYYILPAMAGATNGIATLARQTRSSMLDVIRSDYITTARAKGVPEIQVILKHALKNGLIPIITVIGTQFGKQLGGTMVIETIFAIPGMGQLIINAVNSRDYPVVQSGSIFLAIVFSLCMLVVDLLYAAVDPRIKAQYSKGKVRKKAKVVTANG